MQVLENFTIVSSQPSDLYFWWQLKVQLCNLKKFNLSQYYHILIFIPYDRINEDLYSGWKELELEYPEAKFFYYPDTKNFLADIKKFDYIPLLRPYTLSQHWKKYPELEKNSTLYIDSDVILSKPLELEKFLYDDICYLSDTKSYTSAEYFDSKKDKVDPSLLEAYLQEDVLDKCASFLGINRKIAYDNVEGSGGAQYLLKNIDYKFWNKMMDGCMMIRPYLQRINQKFFMGNNTVERENNGFQSWCADLFSMLFTLWSRGQKTLCPPEYNFSWATDVAEKWEKNSFYHDAGAGQSTPNLFFKRKMVYVNNVRTPFQDDLSYVSPEYCSYFYAKAIEEASPNKQNNN